MSTLGSLSSTSPTPHPTRGALSAAAGFLLWGVFPIYWKQMPGVPATELIAHRIVWSMVFLLAVVAWRREFAALRPAFASLRSFGRNLLAALLLAANWTVYVWAVNQGMVIETSLGYFLVPLVNVAMGALILHERLRRAQWTAIALAAAGVGLLLFRVGHIPWVAFSLAATWSSYGLLKKKSTLGPIAGLTVETLLCFPLCAGLLLWWQFDGTGALGRVDARMHGFILAAGLVTAVPLLLYAYGAQRIRLTTLGLLQYLAPTVQFVIGIYLYHEPFDAARLQAFALIWCGLILYCADGIWTQRRMLLGSK